MVGQQSQPASHWRGRRVFLTGATGLLGSWILEKLIVAGADPVCLVRDHVPRSRAASERLITRATVVTGSMEDYFLLERTIAEYEVETVIHAAAQTIVRIANANPLSTFETNIKGTWNLLEACRRVGTPQSIVVASSDKAYGESDVLPYDESLPLRGQHPYDVSKSCADLIARTYFRTYGLPVTITRCGNFFGPGDLNWNRLIPGTMRSVLRNARPIIRSDGQLRRDYIHVEDAALAYLLLAERTAIQPEIQGEAFNFSNEDPQTAVAVVDLVLAAAGREDLEPHILNESTNEIRHQFLDATKARSVLDWSPRFTLAGGLARTLSWYEEHLSRLDAAAGASTGRGFLDD
jgi:CDP-glucose 4,6-dehydratase